MSPALIAALRLHNQRLTRPGRGGPADVIAWLGAVQAQEYGPAKWALALRMARRTTDAAIDRAVDEGKILRTHLLRPTWHFVTPADIRWMLELTAPQVHRAMSTYHRQHGIDAGTLNRATALFERALGDAHGQCLTRAELSTHLERAGIQAKRSKLALMAMYAEFEGVMCSGARRGNKFTYALLADRAPRAKRFSRDEAVAELTRRYFRSHGPATIRDFVWWSGLKTAEVKRGLEMVRAKSRDADGGTYWTVGRDPALQSGRGAVHLLPIYDELLVAYRDHAAIPRAAFTFGSFLNSLVASATVAGSWRAVSKGDVWMLNLKTTRALTRVERRALAEAVGRHAKFLEKPVTLSTE